MYEFSYHNLFETKGIEYIITIVFFLMLIPFWLFLNRKIRKPEVQLKSISNPQQVKLPRGILFSPNHTWSFMEKGGIASIGIDSLLLNLTSEAELKLMKTSGDSVKKGDIISEINQNGKKLQIASPLTGTITGINDSLQQKLEMAPDKLYNQGWMFKIQPDNWNQEIQHYHLSDNAIEWMKSEYARLKSFVVESVQQISAPTTAPVMLDGGELKEYPMDELPKESWEKFQTDFLNKNL